MKKIYKRCIYLLIFSFNLTLKNCAIKITNLTPYKYINRQICNSKGQKKGKVCNSKTIHVQNFFGS